MTPDQKTQIRKLRRENCSYSNIANTLGVSLSAVKGFCQRNGLAGHRASQTAAPETDTDFCRNCGKPIRQKDKVKTIKFCSKECCQSWWNAHPEQVSRKAVYEYTCPCCGKPFTAYGNSHRKYCSHECYIRDRYKGGGSR